MARLEVEADAEREAAGGAGLHVARLVGRARDGVEVVDGAVGVLDGVLAEAVVVEAGADVVAEVGAEADGEGEGAAGLIGQLGVVGLVDGEGAFLGDEEEVGAQAEFDIGGDVVPEFVVEVADAHLDGDVEVGGGAFGAGLGVVLAEVGADGVPVEVGLEEGGDHAYPNVEAVAAAIAAAEADAGVLADLGVAEGHVATCDGVEVVGGDVGGEAAGGEVAVEED